MYEVYLDDGTGKPVWRYKMWAWLRKRLEYLARDTQYDHCSIRVNGKYIGVKLDRSTDWWEWSAEADGGIPRLPYGGMNVNRIYHRRPRR